MIVPQFRQKARSAYDRAALQDGQWRGVLNTFVIVLNLGARGPGTRAAATRLSQVPLLPLLYWGGEVFVVAGTTEVPCKNLETCL